MKRALAITSALAIGLAMAGCGSSTSATSVVTRTVAATPSVPQTATAPAASTDTASMDTDTGTGNQIHPFGTTITDETGMGRIAVSKTTPGDKVTSEEYQDMYVDRAVKRWTDFTVSVTNLTGKVIETDGMSGAATVGQAQSTCQMTGQDFGGNILPGKTRLYKMRCGSDSQGRLTFELDSVNLGTLGIFTDEP